MRWGAEACGRPNGGGLRPSAEQDGAHVVRLEDGTEIDARAVVLAPGVEWRRLGLPGVERFTGRGVVYGAAGP